MSKSNLNKLILQTHFNVKFRYDGISGVFQAYFSGKNPVILEENMNSQQLRSTFFEFFRSKGHKIVASAPMVVKNDPTLMFTNAGMNQFKDIFLGHQAAKDLRIANTQKCLRVSGKHNDLEEVGHDTYHHTMFEMLGNWSFGDYFKENAIEWAWEFLNKTLNIPADRIYATVFEGSPEENISRDNEAAAVWEKCWKNSSNRILDGSKKDNFWEMGDTGPCGPCSEIHIDLREDDERNKTPGHLLVNKNHPLVIEVWNLVFIQYNRKTDGSLESLPDRHVDTGMGFERLCMAVQGKKSNYDTDIFQKIIAEIGTLSGIRYGSFENSYIAMRVVADHLRAVSFSIADGQLPSNVKAGYVIRRILRRAIRYAYTYLSIEDPFIYRLVPVLIDTMGSHFPELSKQEKNITQVILQEEKTFLNTLGKGIKLIDRKIEELKSENKSVFSGVDAFILYDTYGFPLDLTQLILAEHGKTVDLDEFESEMDKQKHRSRTDATKETDDWVILEEDTDFQFTGYQDTTDNIRITRYRKVKVKGEEQYHLVFNQSPFYAESGGQIGDSGTISNSVSSYRILDTIKENNLTIHVTDTLPTNPGEEFLASVDREKRHFTAYNHTATHLLHHALRQILGKHVEQKGSLVTDEKLRFDFSHFRKITPEEIGEIEAMVNGLIRKDIKMDAIENIPMEEAIDKGAIALFGEKYGERVRVVSFGDSVELCGGTHVKSTANIGLFKIISEGAIAAGIRRIEAITSTTAFHYLNTKLKILEDISESLGKSSNVAEAVIKLVEENEQLRKRFEKLESEGAGMIKTELLQRGEIINNIRVLTGNIKVSSMDMLKNIAGKVRESGEELVLALGSNIEGKANLLLMISKDLVEKKSLDASVIIRVASREINGGGGGQPFLATAGGKNPDGIDAALQKIKEIIAES